MLTRLRRRTAAVALVLLVPALGGCGFGYQTDQVYQPGVGVNERAGSVDVLGAVVVRSSEGEGTLVASLVNQADQDDELVNVTGEGLQTQVVKPVRVQSGALLNLAQEGAVSVSGERVAPGNFVRLNLEFESGQQTEIHAPVVPKSDEYEDVTTAVPTSAATP